MANVRFVSTTQNRQNNREEYDNNALYFCTDSGALYRGAQLLSDGARIVSSYSELPKFNVAADGIIYYTEDTKNGYLLNKSRDGWVSIIDSNSEETKQELKDYIDEKFGSISGGVLDGGEI